MQAKRRADLSACGHPSVLDSASRQKSCWRRGFPEFAAHEANSEAAGIGGGCIRSHSCFSGARWKGKAIAEGAAQNTASGVALVGGAVVRAPRETFPGRQPRRPVPRQLPPEFDAAWCWRFGPSPRLRPHHISRAARPRPSPRPVPADRSMNPCPCGYRGMRSNNAAHARPDPCVIKTNLRGRCSKPHDMPYPGGRRCLTEPAAQAPTRVLRRDSGQRSARCLPRSWRASQATNVCRPRNRIVTCKADGAGEKLLRRRGWRICTGSRVPIPGVESGAHHAYLAALTPRRSP